MAQTLPEELLWLWRGYPVNIALALVQNRRSQSTTSMAPAHGSSGRVAQAAQTTAHSSATIDSALKPTIPGAIDSANPCRG